MKRFFSICLFLAFAATTFAAAPAGRLFQFERSTNRNYICYDVNLKNGVLDEDEPISVYWIRVEEGGVKKELSWIQRKLAFGYKVKKYTANSVVFTLSPSKDVPITVSKKGGKWVAICRVNGKNLQLTKMFAQMHSANSMHCDYVDIYGINTATGKADKERLNNK